MFWTETIKLMSCKEMCKPVHIGSYVLIGAKAIILKGVTIGDGAVIAEETLLQRMCG